MRLIDPTTLAQIASLDMPARDLTSGANPLSDLCGGTYFYLDRHHHAYVLDHRQPALGGRRSAARLADAHVRPTRRRSPTATA